jgi:hypothetical protein
MSATPDSVAAMASRRPRGTGSIRVRTDKAGHETYYGIWWTNGRQVQRRIGPKRREGTRQGLTAVQAEAELRRLIGETTVQARVGERLNVDEVSRRYRCTPNAWAANAPPSRTSNRRPASTSRRSSRTRRWTPSCRPTSPT